MGRRSTFTQEIADEICLRLSQGETLSSICKDEHMPERRVVYAWQAADEAFAAQVASARAVGYDAIADDCMAIADDSGRDYTMTDKGLQFDGEHVQRSKLRIWARQELLKKWDPRRYGDKLDLNHSGALSVTVQKLSGKAEE